MGRRACLNVLGKRKSVFAFLCCTVYVTLQVSFTYAVRCMTKADAFQMEKLICKVNIWNLFC